MVNRIAFWNEPKERRSLVPRFGDLRAQQPLYLAAPPCAVPPLVATECLDLMRGSISLSLLEKCHFFKQLPKLSQEKIEGCLGIGREEQRRFRDLPDSHQSTLVRLERCALTDWWRVEHWFWQQGQLAFEPMLWFGRVETALPANVEYALKQMLPV